MKNFASTYHDYIVEAMENYKGQDLKTGEILKILINRFPELEVRKDWIQPPDHCINHTNKGACYCAETDKAVFEQVKHGTYKVRKNLYKL